MKIMNSQVSCFNCYEKATSFFVIVALAKAKVTSIFSRLRNEGKAKTQIENNETKHRNKSIKKIRSSNYFLEALKSGGISLS